MSKSISSPSKFTLSKRRAALALAAAAVATLAVNHVARAASAFWDADGDTTTATGGTGTWDTSSALWRPGSATGTPLGTWVNDGAQDAFLGGTAGTLTLGTNISANSVQFSSTGSYTLSSTTNTLTTGTIRNSSNAQQFVLANVLGVGGQLTIENNNAASGASGATITNLQGMLSMNSGALTQLNIAGPTGGSYFKYNQVRLWNPLYDPFNAGVFNDGARNPWDINTVINVTGDYAMLAGSTSAVPNHAATHNFRAAVHTNNSKLLLASSLGNSLSFFGGIDGNGDVIITTNDPSQPGAGQGAVRFSSPATYTGVTRIMNSKNGSGGGGGTSFGVVYMDGTNFLPATTRLIFGDTGFTTAGALNLDGFDQTVQSIESVANIDAIGIINNVFLGAYPHNTLTINGGLTSTFGAPIGITANPGNFVGNDGIALNFPSTNTGTTTLTNANSLYTDGTVISGGTLISKNTLNNGTTSPVGTGSVTVNGTGTSHGTFGGTGQVIGAVATNQFAHLAPGGVGAVDVANPLTLNSGLTLANGSTVDAEFNGFGNDVVNANALTLSGVSAGDHSVTLNLADLGAGFHNGTFTLINYSSLSGGDLSNFGLTLPVGANPSNFTLGNTGSAITVAITGYASTITWSGSINSTWDAGSPSTGTANWSPGPTKFFNGDLVNFDDTAATQNVTVAAGGVAPSNMTINAGGSYTFSGGAISGGVGSVLNKTGSGTATFSNAVSFPNGFTVNGGTLAVGAAGTLSGGAITLNNNSTLGISAASNISGVPSITANGGTIRADASFSTNRPITFTTASGLTVNTQANNVTLSGVLTGTGVPLSKTGTGTLLISTPTAMTGAVTVSAGTLALSTGTAGVSSGGVTVNGGATIQLQATQNGYSPTASGGTFTLKDNSTLKFSGESGHLGGSGIVFENTTFVTKNVFIQGADANSRLVTRNFLKNTFSEPDADTTIHLTGAGIMHVGSGSLAVTATNNEFSGTWQLDSGFSGVLSVGPLLNGNNTEVLIGLGYNAPNPAGPTRPVIVNSGTLAVGADARDGATGTANAATNISGAFRSKVTLAGGNIASTGREYSSVTNVGDNYTGTGNASSNTPVTARYAGDIVLSDGTTSKVLLFDPITLENYDNSANPSLLAQNTNPTGPRSLRFVTDIPTSNGTTPGRADVPSNFNWGSNTTLVADSGAQSGGILSFERTPQTAGSNVTVGTNATLQINSGGTVKLAGTIDALKDSSGPNLVNLVNNSTDPALTRGLWVSTATPMDVGTISGNGDILVDAGATLTGGGAVTGNRVTNNGTVNFLSGNVVVGNVDGAGTLNIGGTSSANHFRQNTLALAAGSHVSVNPDGGNAGVSVLSNLNIPGGTDAWTAQMDVKNNDIVLRSTGANRVSDVARITNQLKLGLNASPNSNQALFWTGQGIVTSSGWKGGSNYTGIGVTYNDKAAANLAPGPLYTTFDGQTVGVNDVLVKYTWFGDADLDGQVTSNDYFQIDTGFLAGRTGWINGDFDYNGVVNTNDYFLIDSAFLAQGATVLAPSGTAAAAPLSGVTAVPEPASLGVFAFAGVGILMRRRRR